MRNARTAFLALLALAGVFASPSGAADPKLEEKVGTLAVGRGVAWLRKHQQPDGSFLANVGFKMNDGYVVTRSETPHLGVTALAGLALLHGPDGEDAAARRKSLKKALDYVLSCRDEDGMFIRNGTRMYSHAFVTYFLAEAWRITGEERLKSPLRSALFATCKTQGGLGGWGYAPWDREVDITQTACQLLALQAGRRAGIELPEEVLHRALGYVIESAVPADRPGRGAFYYEWRPAAEPTRTSYCTCAAGLASLLSFGLDTQANVEGYLRTREPERRGGRRIPPDPADSVRLLGIVYRNLPAEHYSWYFGNLFASQALRAVGGKPWKDFRRRVRRDLLRRQKADGSWPVHRVGAVYGTASACLILSELELPVVPLRGD